MALEKQKLAKHKTEIQGHGKGVVELWQLVKIVYIGNRVDVC